MKRTSRYWIRVVVLTALLLAFTSGCREDDEKDNRIPGGDGVPTILITYTPKMYSYENLRGQVLHVNPKDYCVVVYIQVGGGWWIKPYWADPTTTINANGTWVCDVTTGGIDERARKFAAFLFPIDYIPDSTFYQTELEENALAFDYVTR